MPQGPYKPTRLQPRPDVSRAPRGQRLVLPFSDPAWFNVGSFGRATPANIGSAIVPAINQIGFGAQFSGASGSTNLLSYPAENTSLVSLEALIITGSSIVSQGILAFNDASIGNSTTADKSLIFNASSQLLFSDFSGGNFTLADTTTTYATNTLYHIVAVEDGTNARIYLNGAQVASSAHGGSFAGYSTPFLIIGSVTPGAGDNVQKSSNITVLYAGYANVGWAAQEVAQRYADVFGFLRPARRPRVGVAAAGGTFQPGWAVGSNVLVSGGYAA